jgi:hypothetical protein
LTINYRQTDPELKAILDYYRYTFISKSEILHKKEFRIITQDELINEVSENNRILTSLHAHRNIINNNIYETDRFNIISIMMRKSSDKKQKTLPYLIENYERKVVNELFYVTKNEYERHINELDLAFATTIHYFQGKTI